MTAVTTAPPSTGADDLGAGPSPGREPVGGALHRILGAIPTGVLWVLVALWTIPTLGMLVSSFRPEIEVKTTGWWTVFPDPFPESKVLAGIVALALLAVAVILVALLARLYRPAGHGRTHPPAASPRWWCSSCC